MTRKALPMAMRATFSALFLASAGCVHAPPKIDGVPSAPSRPDAYWSPPPSAMVAMPPRPAPSSTPDSMEQLSLSAVVDLALRNNPATRISWARARAAAEAYGESRGALYPAVSADVGVTRSKSSTPNGIERTQYGPAVTLSHLVLDFGGRSGSIEAARQIAIAADFAHNVTVQNTILQAEAATFGYLATRALRDAERAATDEAAANLAAAEERHRVGLATIADVLQARTARAQQQLNLETLDGQLQVTRGSLAVAMGLPANAPFDLPDVAAPDSATVRAVTLSVDSVIALAIRNRPDLAAAQADAARAAAEVRVSRSALWPALALGATTGYLGSNIDNFAGRSYSVSVGIQIPLFTGFSSQYGARAAAANADAALARTALTRQQVELDVFVSYYALQTATQRVRSSADLLTSARESEQVARGRYTEGVGSIVDLLIAQSALANARAQAIGARWQWRTALAQLAHDAGVLGIHGEAMVPLNGAPGGGR